MCLKRKNVNIYSYKILFAEAHFVIGLSLTNCSPSKMEPFLSRLNLPLMFLKAFRQQVRQPRFKLWLKFALQTRVQLSKVYQKFSSRSHTCRLISCQSVYFASIFSVEVGDFGCYCALSVVRCLIESLSPPKGQIKPPPLVFLPLGNTNNITDWRDETGMELALQFYSC